MAKGKHGRLKRIVIGLLVCLFLGISFSRAEAADMADRVTELRIEQVHAAMPEIRAYYYMDNEQIQQNGSTVQGVFGGEKLATESVQQYDKEEGMNYYFLLDVSASISDEYFRSIQDAVFRFQSKMNPSDRLTLITFGDSVKVIFENQGADADCKDLIYGLANDDMLTSLFEAIDKTANMADTEENAMKRSVAFVFSDGEDFTTNKTTADEALKTLQQTGLPVYSMVTEKTKRGEDNTYIDDFGEFSRNSGGILTVFNEENAWKKLKKARDGLYQAMVLVMRADRNQTYQTMQPLTVTVDGQVSQTVSVLADRAVADTTVPEAKAEELSAREIQVTFSERVLYADVPGNYRIVNEEGEALAGYTVSYTESSGYKAVLTFENELYDGEYEISYLNICDDSNEANPVTAANTLTIADGQKEEKGAIVLLKKYWAVLVAVLTVAVVLVIILIFYFRIKKNKGVVVLDGKVTFGENVDVRKKVEIRQEKGHTIIFEMNDRKTGKKELPMIVSQSLFVGRSDICDLYFNDEMLSKQHFVVEEGEDGFYIQDLGTTNGTMVNGVRINQRRKLNKGDTINAGRVEMTVRW